jgi:hypothetical protein
MLEIEGRSTRSRCLEAYYGRDRRKTEYVMEIKVVISYFKFT